MEIKDLAKEKLVKELFAGDIVNCSGSPIMITDIVNEEGNEIECVHLNGGKMDILKESLLIEDINDPNKDVRLVSESELHILDYH